MKLTITVDLDIPDELLAAVNDEAYRAIERINADASARRTAIHQVANRLQVIVGRGKLEGATLQAVQELRDQANSLTQAETHVTALLSELTHATGAAESQRRVAEGRKGVTA